MTAFVVVFPFGLRVDADDVPDVDLHTVRRSAVCNALQLFPVLLFDVGPHHVLGGVAKERPVLVVVVLRFEHHHLQRVFDLGREKIAILKSDVMRRALKMHVSPSVFCRKTIRSLQLSRMVHGIGSGRERKNESQKHSKQNAGFPVHGWASGAESWKV